MIIHLVWWCGDFVCSRIGFMFVWVCVCVCGVWPWARNANGWTNFPMASWYRNHFQLNYQIAMRSLCVCAMCVLCVAIADCRRTISRSVCIVNVLSTKTPDPFDIHFYEVCGGQKPFYSYLFMSATSIRSIIHNTAPSLNLNKIYMKHEGAERDRNGLTVHCIPILFLNRFRLNEFQWTLPFQLC